VIGETLTVASLMVLSGAQPTSAQDVVDGQKLALAQAGGRAGAYKVNFMSVDAGAADAAERPGAVAEASRQVLTDSQVIAVIGPLDSGAVMTALPLLNAAGLLQVSPGGGYRGFTDPTATPGEPERFSPSGRRTFARVAGDDRALAAAMARAAGRARTAAVEADPGPVAGALAAELREAARDRGLALTGDPQRADVIFYSGGDPETLAAIARSAERVIAANDAALATELGQAAGRVRFVVPTAPADPTFAAEFERVFGRAPSSWAGLGHEAMRRILETIRAAGPRAADRGQVAERYLETRWPAGGFAVQRPAPAG
jgi:branched-chain amino acid transport system substrate-binding protein